MKTVSAALLGSTGAVGQRYVSMLKDHPYIRLEVLMGDESAGKRYGDAARWLSSEEIPAHIADRKVEPSLPESAEDCDVVFSAIPAEAAAKLEQRFAKSGRVVISEASAHRMDADVPLMIPEVNHDHLAMLESQRRLRAWKGALVATPNCTVTGLAIVLKPLLDSFKIRKAVVTSMQAVSGAGFPGVPSLLIAENVIPYIKGEEDKVADESRKILGTRNGGGVGSAEFQLAVSCNRVPVIDGHMETLYGEFPADVEPEAVTAALEGFRSRPQDLRLPSAPQQPIIVRKEHDRPQPRLDRMSGTVPGMSVVVGRVRNGPTRDSIQLTLLSHNTIRGAAGTAILTAELMQRQGYLES